MHHQYKLKDKNFNKRVYITSAIICICFFVIFIRFIFLQLFYYNVLEKKADIQHKKIININLTRNEIRDIKGNPLAISIPVKSVYAVPYKIKDEDVFVKNLSGILNISESDFHNKLKKSKYFVWLRRKISNSVYEQLKLLNLDGLEFIDENKRFYPLKHSMAHIIGFCNIDNEGLSGVEYEYNRYLKGNPAKLYIQRDGKGRYLYNQKYTSLTNDDKIMYLTANKNIQHVVEEILQNTVQKTRARSGSIIVMNPYGGDILALANYPTFNLNDFSSYKPFNRKNRALVDVFEPGSTFKIVTVSSALENGFIQKDQIFYCEDGLYKTKWGHKIHDSEDNKWLDVPSIIEKSSNIGAVKIAETMGARNFFSYIHDFGFGEKTGIDLPGESKGIIRDLSKWSGFSLSSIAIGQEISVTAIQLVTCLSVVANGGYLVQPHVLDRIEKRSGGVLYEYIPRVKKRVISNRTSKIMQSILSRVVRSGTGLKANIKGIEIAGKTGTAQKFDFRTGKYSKDKYVAIFYGFLPVEDPQLAILVMIDEPHGSYYGGSVAAPAFREVVTKIQPYMTIYPEKFKVKNNNTIKIVQKFENFKENVQNYSNLINETKKQKENIGRMPALKGLSMKETFKILKELRVKPYFFGTGFVRTQIPKPGEKIYTGQNCYIQFKGKQY